MTKYEKDRLLEPRFVFKATAVNHISYGVSDSARSRDFYVELFNMDCVYDDGKSCYLAFGRPRRVICISESTRPGKKPFVDHVGFSIRGFDMKVVKAKLNRFGLAPKSEGDYAFSLLDPDGYRIQVCAEKGVFPETVAHETDGTGGKNTRPGVFKASAVNHIAYHVADYARSRDFYMDLFGMELRFEDGKKCSVAFGEPEDAIYITPSRRPDKKPCVDHLGISIKGFNLLTVEGELKRLGLNPEPDGDYAWTIFDPDGYKIQVCAEKGVFPGAALVGR